MKIALCAWESVHAIEIGGVSAHVFGLAAALAKRGHETHLFTRQGEQQSHRDLIAGVHFHRCPSPTKADFFSEIAAFNESLYFYLRDTAAAIGGFNLIHCHDWLTFDVGLRWQREQNSRFIATFHTTEWGRSGAWPERGDALKIAETELAAVRDAAGIIAVSQEIKRQIDLLYHAPEWKTRIIHYGIDCLPLARNSLIRHATRRKYAIADDAPTALFAGSLNERKGADIVLNHLPEMIAQIPNVKIIFAGGGELSGRLREISAQSSSSQAVIHLTDYSREELAALYYAADAVLLPYRYDPFGANLLATWEAARPAIFCGNGAGGEILYEQVNGVKTTPENFGSAVVNLLNNLEHAKWLGMNGRAAAETAFSWNGIAERVAEIYQAALAETASSPDEAPKSEN